MEEKVLKTQIFENKTVKSETSEQPIDVDFTLPDYYPDIKKILKCCCKARISSKGINGNTVTGEGTATVTTIYLDGEDMLNSYEYQYPFSKSFDAPDLSGNACVCVKAKTDYINCRAVTARKIDIHGAISVTAALTEKVPMDIVSDVDLEDVQIKRKNIAANTPLSCSEKTVSVEEDIEIGAGLKDINCLIRYGAEAVINDSKLIGNKAMVKGELSVNLLYCNEEGEMATLKEILPFSQMIEVEAVGENCGIDTNAEISLLEIKPKSDAEGKTRSFSVNARILVCVDTYCSNEIPVVLDAYSRKYETSIEKKEVTFNNVITQLNENFPIKQALDFEGVSISRVIDVWCLVKTGTTKITGGNLTVDGVLTVNILANDADSVPGFYSREIPFDYSYDLALSNDNLYAEPSVTVSGCSYTLTGTGGMEIRAEMNIGAAIYECVRKTVLTDIAVDYEKPAKRPNDCAMTVYFASSGESLWDIASKYLANIEEIKQINDVTDDILKTDKMILVPIS